MLIYLCHIVLPMPTITIYLTNDLYDKVRDAPSKTVRAALEYYFRNKDESGQGSARPQPRDGEPGETKNPAENE